MLNKSLENETLSFFSCPMINKPFQNHEIYYIYGCLLPRKLFSS